MARRTIDIGIDLGTTNSEIACIENGEVKVFKNYLRSEFTPSVVRIDEKGTIIVGRKAYERLVDDEENTVSEFKRWIGTQQVKAFKASGQKLKAEDLSAEVLKDLKVTAKNYLPDDEINAAVITVPCNFEIVQCEATQRAAKLAGIKYAPLLQEPIAASIAYGFLEKMPKGFWVVYDLGGGTFDVAIMSAKEGRLAVVDHCGDNYLGGKDFDWTIVEGIIYPILKKEYDLPGLGRTKEYGALNAVLKSAAEEAKIELSQRDSVNLTIHALDTIKDKSGHVIDISIPMKRIQYEPLIEDYVEKSIKLFRKTLDEQRLSASDISQLILVGGPTQTPYIRKRLKDEFNINTDYRIDPMTVVAEGAAVFAASQLMPEEFVTRDYSKVAIKLAYNPMTTDINTPVGGKLSAASSGGNLANKMRVQIKSVSGDWESGMIEVKDNAFYCSVSLREKKINSFKINLLDEFGNSIPADPDTFSITQGISVAEPPLTRSIGVELVDGSFDKHLHKGDPLPARGKPKTYRTSVELLPGDAEGALNIHVYEGESPIANRNRHLGTLKIKGDMVKRAIPENTEVDIVIAVDQSRSVKAEAFIQRLDQNFANVIENKISLKLSPEDIYKDLEQEEKRLQKIKNEIGLAEDPDMNRKVEENNPEDKIAEIKRDINAAKGGDPDAVEKADRRLKELKEILDPIEYLTNWPNILREFNEILSDCQDLINSHGDTQDTPQFESLRRASEKAISDKDVKRLQKITADLNALKWVILFKQPGYWISAFQEIKKDPSHLTNQARVAELIEEGSMALQRQDTDSLKSIMLELWSFVSRDEQEKIGERISDSGLKKG